MLTMNQSAGLHVLEQTNSQLMEVYYGRRHSEIATEIKVEKSVVGKGWVERFRYSSK